MRIERLNALSDNYIFGWWDPGHGGGTGGVVVDPGDARPVLAWLDRVGAILTAILITHHHWDHVTGIDALVRRFPNVRVYGGAADRDRIPHQTDFLQDGDRLQLLGRDLEVLFLPGHTLGHVAYYVVPLGDLPGELFCGDVLFGGGCGRLKEGTPAQMLDSLRRLRSLPDDTRVWCAHEYTLGNLKFALTVDGENESLRSRYGQVEKARSRGEATIPLSLGLEKATNPFLRWDVPALQRAVAGRDELQTFSRLRGRKDLF
ncbi:MAG: hydroxyacylglutathione hydrolase [Cyanobacteria bacterium]|nr:hydroxyacylglutathione hydrolase [Cyanobacteriota bacterium]